MPDAAPALLHPENAGPSPASAGTLWRATVLISWGVFVSTLAQTATLGRQPLQAILKDHLHVEATRMSAFMSLANLAWYFKPLAGLLTDNVPIFGLRLRYYLIFGSLAAAAAWGILAIVPVTYGGLLLVCIVMNVMLVVVSTTTGGLLVEAGQKLGATGRLSAARTLLLNVAVIAGGPLGGYLATRAFGWTAGISAGMLLTFVPIVLIMLREPRQPARTGNAMLKTAWQQLKQTLKSRGLWAAAGLLFLVHTAPGFSTPLYYHMRDALHFSPELVGYTDGIQGAAGVVAALLYVWLCRGIPLRWLYASAIAVAALSALPFLALSSWSSAVVIFSIYGLGISLADVASLDLAARATPKGSEATGYAVMIGVWNIGLAVSDLVGSLLFDKQHVPFSWLVWLNAGTTALVLVAVPFLPKGLVRGREGEPTAAA
jgi:predicted MFS family arabinose efflux permease